MRNKTKLIIIDLYGVISRGSYKNICRYIAKKYRLPFERVYNIVYHKYFSAAAVGKISEAQSFSQALKELRIKAAWQKIRRLHYKYISRLNKAALEFSKTLQNKGFTVLILSKNTREQFNFTVNKFGLKKYFKNIINTLDLKLPKASKKTFLWILKKFKLRPGEIVFVDDQIFNLPEAKKMGVRTIHYKNLRQMKKDLAKALKK